jgi:hypothetical protein
LHLASEIKHKETMNAATKCDNYFNEANTKRLGAKRNGGSSFVNNADDEILSIASPKRRNFDLDISRSSEHTFDERCHKALIYTVCCSFHEDEDDDDFSVSTSCSGSTEFQPVSPARIGNQKEVRFSETMTVREFSITVGDPALSADSCPLTLDWVFLERKRCLNESPRSSALRRLNVYQRRERVAQVQGITINEVRSIEIERVLERMEDTMHLQESYLEELIEAEDESESGNEWIEKRTLNIDGIREYRDETDQSSRARLWSDRDWSRALPDDSESETSSQWLMNASLRDLHVEWSQGEEL